MGGKREVGLGYIEVLILIYVHRRYRIRVTRTVFTVMITISNKGWVGWYGMHGFTWSALEDTHTDADGRDGRVADIIVWQERNIILPVTFIPRKERIRDGKERKRKVASQPASRLKNSGLAAQWSGGSV